jgi:hypothetical protein
LPLPPLAPTRAAPAALLAPGGTAGEGLEASDPVEQLIGVVVGNFLEGG